MKARLVTLRDGSIDLSFPLQEGGVTIGRTPDNLIQIPDPEISKRHARVWSEDGAWKIEDLGSKNGTRVNGAAAHVVTRLADGDRLHLGSHELVFVLSGEENVPTHVIDLESRAYRQTMSGNKPPS